MASDYQGADSVKAFAERRGITFRERVADMVREVPEKVRSIFANFRPPDRQLSVAGRDAVRTRNQKREVERYARAAVGLAHMREHRLPVLPHQRDALEKAGRALDAVRPARQRVVEGKNVSVPLDPGGRRNIKNKKNN